MYLDEFFPINILTFVSFVSDFLLLCSCSHSSSLHSFLSTSASFCTQFFKTSASSASLPTSSTFCFWRFPTSTDVPSDSQSRHRNVAMNQSSEISRKTFDKTKYLRYLISLSSFIHEISLRWILEWFFLTNVLSVIFKKITLLFCSILRTTQNKPLEWD